MRVQHVDQVQCRMSTLIAIIETLSPSPAFVTGLPSAHGCVLMAAPSTSGSQ